MRALYLASPGMTLENGDCYPRLSDGHSATSNIACRVRVLVERPDGSI